MANDTSNTPRFKSPHHSTQSATESKNKEIVVEGDSTHNDSLTIVHQ